MVTGKSWSKRFGGQDPGSKDREWDPPAPHICQSLDWGGWGQAQAVGLRESLCQPFPSQGSLDPTRFLPRVRRKYG